MTPAGANPFRVSRLAGLPPVWEADGPAGLARRWEAAGRRGALVGPHGTGKSTRLRALAAHLADGGWNVVAVQWHDDGTTTPPGWARVLAAPGPRDLVCLDGSENAGALTSLRLRLRLRRAGGVLATLHRPARWLPTLAVHRPDPAVFVAHACALDPGCADRAREAFAAARGNAHEAFRRLYLGT